MALPLPELDDRRFDDLVAELRSRLGRDLPELTQISPGDPVHAFIDMFAWLTETVIYRANLIPERQRRAFLNLLQVPLRPAQPARGIVSIDPTDGNGLSPLIGTEALLKAGEINFTTTGEIQPAPLELRILVKEMLDDAALDAAGISRAQLEALYQPNVVPFRPKTLYAGRDLLNLGATLDQALYLACVVPARALAQAGSGAADKVVAEEQWLNNLRQQLAGITLSLGVVPPDQLEGNPTSTPTPRHLQVDIAWQKLDGLGNPDPIDYLPLEIVEDGSKGGRTTGILRVRLPSDANLLKAPAQDDPRDAGAGTAPPEAPADLKPRQLLFWLRLSCPEDPAIQLNYLAINAVAVIGQGIVRNLPLPIGTGRPDQILSLPHGDIEPIDFGLEVTEQNAYVPWQQVEHFGACGPQDQVFVLDAASGTLQFGDGIRGKRPPAGAGIRAVFYRFGGGVAGNLPAGSIKELNGNGGKFKVRHEIPTSGGRDRESIPQAEKRIPAFLTHRDRAVTREDYAVLARDNPVNPVGRAEAVSGFIPGTSLANVRRNIPGAVSVFVIPPLAPALATAPKPTVGLLKDVFEYLRNRAVLGTELYVLSPDFLPISVGVSVRVMDPATEQQTLKAVQKALLLYLWALPPGGAKGEGWPFGGEVDANELKVQVARVPGIMKVVDLRLFAQNGTSGSWREVVPGNTLLLQQDYQLPKLMAISVTATGSNAPEPTGFGPSAGTVNSTGPQPVPVIPDIC